MKASTWKPEADADKAVEHIRRLQRLAEHNYEVFYEPIREFGTSPLKVFFFLYVNDGWASAEEIIRATGLSKATVYHGISKLRVVGWLEERRGMFRLIPRFRSRF